MYASRYTDKMVTPANHIVEILMERKAAKDGKKLVREFWSKAEYKKTYNLNLIQVSAVLNAYSEKAVLNALNKETWAWSLSPKVKQCIIEEEAKLKRIEAQRAISEAEIVKPIVSETELPLNRPSFNKSKLGNL